MKNLVFGLLTATAFISAPAAAKDGAVYLGLGGGVVLPEDVSTDSGIAVDNSLGWEAEAVVGYDLGLVRLELEGAYKNFSIDEIDSGAAGLFTGTDPDTALPIFTGGVFDDPDADVDLASGMINALLDFGGEDGRAGFSVGGGVGITNVRLFDLRSSSGSELFLDDNDIRFAWQGIAQVRLPLSDNLEASLKYKYHNVDNVLVTDEGGRNLQTDITTHSALATLIFNFGGREAALLLLLRRHRPFLLRRRLHRPRLLRPLLRYATRARTSCSLISTSRTLRLKRQRC